jgi:hypothetical protein
MFVSFFSVFLTNIETTETNRTVSKQTETILNFHNENKICSLSNCFGWYSENNGFGIEAKQPKQIISKQTKTNRNKLEKIFCQNTKISSLSNCFGCSSVCFGSIETPKLSVSVSETTERNVLFWIVPKLVSVPVSIVSN